MTILAFLFAFAHEPRVAVLPRVPSISRPDEETGNRHARRRDAKRARAR